MLWGGGGECGGAEQLGAEEQRPASVSPQTLGMFSPGSAESKGLNNWTDAAQTPFDALLHPQTRFPRDAPA